MADLIRRLPGALLRNCVLLAAEFGAIWLLRGPEGAWIPVLLAVFVIGAAVPHGTGAEFVARTAVALTAVGIAVAGGTAWDRHTLHERGREEVAVVASRTMVEDGSGSSPSLRLRTQAGRELPGPVARDLAVGARLAVTTDPDGPAWSPGPRPPEPLWQGAATAALLLLQTAVVGRLSLRRPHD
uniref:Integral membrane protein n=1 Tax=Streptomyces sp. NBC_00049 TaxID=2903617 RepID=A0AAU2JPE6_9ACTN